MPKGKTKSVLDWKLLNSQMPFAFSFLLGQYFISLTHSDFANHIINTTLDE